MAKLNLTQAAKAAGIARGTLYKHIDEGKISCQLDDKGKRVIDTSELMRVYGEIKQPETTRERTEERPIKHKETREETEVTQVLRERIEDLEKQIEDLRQDKEANRKRESELLDIVKQQQTLLLPPGDTEKDGKDTKKTGFFGRLFGGKKQN